MIRLVLFLTLLAAPAAALDLALPGATVTRSESSPADSVRLPDGPWTPDRVLTGTEGAVRRTAYRLPDASRTSLQMIIPLREKLQTDGFEQVFACADAACGGFDFRFELDLLTEPDMHVDLGNYRYVLMTRSGADPHTVSIVASSSATAGFVHVTEVSKATLAALPGDTPDIQPTPPVAGDVIGTLIRDGRAVLADLEFAVGSADLGVGPFASLSELSLWLRDNAGARVILVGHTDAVGSLDANTSLSQRRAAAVAARLVENGTDPTQLQSAGAGFLAPLSTNLSDDGRAANRRVEVVLLSLN